MQPKGQGSIEVAERNPSYFLEKAGRCFRIAASVADETVADELRQLGLEFIALASDQGGDDQAIKRAKAGVGWRGDPHVESARAAHELIGAHRQAALAVAMLRSASAEREGASEAAVHWRLVAETINEITQRRERH
jgi:hypothetical protein